MYHTVKLEKARKSRYNRNNKVSHCYYEEEIVECQKK